jgi:hypothetical protein
VLKETTCITGGSGGGGGGGGAGSGPCGTGGLAGRDTLTALFNCVANLRMSPERRFMRCTAEATGRCSNPVDRFTKQLQEASYGGVPLGGCQISQGGHGGKKPEEKDPPGTVYGKDGVPLYPLIDYEKNVKDADQKVDEAKAKVQEEQDDLANKTNSDDLKKAEEDLKKAQEAAEKAQKDLDAAKKKTEESKKAVKKDSKGRCAEDTPDCGSNGCTAMSEQMQEMMKCAEASFGDRDVPELPNSGVIDPSPDSPDANSAMARCMATLNITPVTDTHCWAVQCARDQMTTAPAGGDCGCGSTVPEGGLASNSPEGGFCGGFVDCGEDKVQQGCKCVASGGMGGGGVIGGGVVGGGPGPHTGPKRGGEGPLTMSAPPTYSDVRYGGLPR